MQKQTNEALPDSELVALELLLERPNTTLLQPDVIERLLAKGLVERRAGALIVTSRGHAELLKRSNR